MHLPEQHRPPYVLPLVGDAQELLALLGNSLPGPVHVAATGLTTRERTLLSRLPEVQVLDVETDRVFGALAVAAVRLLAEPVLLVDGDAPLPGSVPLPRHGTPVQHGPGWLRLTPADIDAPVLTAATDLASLTALTVQLLEGPGRRLTAHGRPVLSAALIVKDEQAALPACLGSLRGLVDEIVVCDTGSSDRTVQIAEAFGARIVHTPWTNDFAAARNVALEACLGAWVLSIDADERLVVTDRAALRRSLTPRGAGALGVLIKSVTDDGGVGGFEHEAVRLFRCGSVQWTGAVHESIVSRSTGQPPEAIRLRAVHLVHEGYRHDLFLARDKAARNLLLAEKDYATAACGESSRPRAKAAYELARALSMHPSTASRQRDLLLEALEHAPADLPRLQSSIAVRLAGLLREAGELARACEVAAQAVALTPSDPAATLQLAASLAGDDRPAEALDALDAWRSAPTAGDREVVVRNAVDVDVVIPSVRAVLLGHLGRTDEAIDELSRVARTSPLLFTHWDALVGLLLVADPSGWAARVADLCPLQAPHAMLAAVTCLSADQQEQLHDALRQVGIEAKEHTSQARTSHEVDQILDAHADADIACAAAALEDEDPELARQTWLRTAWSSTRQVALARCHLALDQVPDALDALDGIDPEELGPADRITVAWLAAHAGDADLALALLDSLPPDLGPLEDQVEALRRVLPERVHSSG